MERGYTREVFHWIPSEKVTTKREMCAAGASIRT